MHQREAARAAWLAAGLHKTADARLRRFLEIFEKQTDDCWPQLLALVRQDFPDYVEPLATALWNSGDALLRVNLIRNADLTRKEEAALVKRWSAALDPGRERRELVAVVERDHIELLDKVLARKQLPDSLRLAAHERRLRIEEP